MAIKKKEKYLYFTFILIIKKKLFNRIFKKEIKLYQTKKFTDFFNNNKKFPNELKKNCLCLGIESFFCLIIEKCRYLL